MARDTSVGKKHHRPTNTKKYNNATSETKPCAPEFHWHLFAEPNVTHEKASDKKGHVRVSREVDDIAPDFHALERMTKK